MRLLYIPSYEDLSYIPIFERLPALRGHKVSVLGGGNSVTDVAKVAALCKAKEIDAVICGQDAFLEAALRSTSDWLPPKTNKKISSETYGGSIIHAMSGQLTVLSIRPLFRLKAVPSESYVLNRYLSKLTQPEQWFPQTEFRWKEVTLDNRHEVIARLATAYFIAEDIETVQDEFRSITDISWTGVWYKDGRYVSETYGIKIEEPWHYEVVDAINSNSVPKCFQNGLYDNTYFLRFHSPVNNWLYDTFHLFHSWYSELPKRLDYITAFAIRDVRYWKDESEQDKLRYCCKDSWATANSWLALMAEVPEWAIENYLQEFPLVFPCINAAVEGLDCDVAILQANREKFETRNEELLARIRTILGEPTFNPNSPPQMDKLFEVLGAKQLGLKGTGKIPAQKLAASHPFADWMLRLTTEYKENSKLISNYLDQEKVWYGKILYSINPGTTETGRCNSEASAFWCGFQIQNVPGGPDVKGALHAPAGWYLAEADKAQSEARCVGYLSGEESLINLVESSHDYHSWNASAFFGIPYEEIYDEATGKKLLPEIRDLSKRTNHGANYNMTAPVMLDTMGPVNVFKAKVTLKLPSQWSLRNVCQYLLDKYAATYPGVKKDWYEWIKRTVKTSKMLVSPFGWTRYCFGDIDQKPVLNALVAHGPQNLSVAYVNREWYAIWRETVYGSLRHKVRIKAQIHDSLLFLYKEKEDALRVQEMMNLTHPVTDCKGVTRNFRIPTDLSLCKVKGQEQTRIWAEVK